MDCRLFHRLASSLSNADGAGSLHYNLPKVETGDSHPLDIVSHPSLLTSGRKTMKERGSSESPSSRSKCVIVASSNSSENGGFASKEPHCGLNSKNGLETGLIEINRPFQTRCHVQLCYTKPRHINILNYHNHVSH